MIDVEQRGHVSVFHMIHGKANALDVEFCEAMTARLEAYRHASTPALVLTWRARHQSARFATASWPNNALPSYRKGRLCKPEDAQWW